MMTRTSYSQGIFLTDVQRDSAYAKIQRGKVNAERVKILELALQSCDSVKAIKTEIIGIQQVQSDSLYAIIDNKEMIIDKLTENVKLEVKRGRRRAFWSFLRGTGVGIVLAFILNTTL